ncbi:MAG: peptidylprolyl isomerase [Sedimentisphaerales bacterium]|nr:peptidylprolyl isomerase [Sedimentisphaerales bacterium]
MKRIFGFLFILLMVMTGAVSAGTPKSFVIIETNYGDMALELYPDKAPVTVENFLGYVNSGFYEGLIFHRVIEDFMIQAGAYDADLYTFLEDPNYSDPNWMYDPLYYHEPGDPIVNEAGNGLKNLRGTISMARGTDPDSATSQFFINHVNNSSLNYGSGSAGYCVFGSVLAGISTVDTIAELPTEEVNNWFEDIPEPNGAVISRITEIHSFDSNSSDLSNVPFLRAQDGTFRTFAGQGAYRGLSFTQRFTAEELMDVDCLKWQQSAVESAGIDGFSMWLVRDAYDGLWIYKYVLNENTANEQVVIEAEDIGGGDAVSFEEFAEGDMHFRMMVGLHKPGNLDDPNNIVTTGTGADLQTQQIVRVDESIEPDFADPNLVLVKETVGPEGSESQIRWSYYRKDVGEVLTLWMDPADPQAHDPNALDTGGDGWRLAGMNFDEDSADFSEVDYLKIPAGQEVVRSYFGQGIYQDNNFTDRYAPAAEAILGVNCLEWQRQVDDPNELGDFTINLARDKTGEIWVFNYTFDGEPIVDANSILDVVRLRDLDDRMALRLISGAVDPDNLSDPNHLIIKGTEPNEVRQQIVSFTGSLEHLPWYDGELVVVKTWNPTDEDDVGWSFYHDSVGLVLDLRQRSLDSGNPKFFDPADTGGIDTSWDGWRLGWYGQAEPVFDESSDNFLEVPFLKAGPGTLRVYRGQGTYDGANYKMLGSRQRQLEVLCLKIDETEVAQFSRPAGTLLIARDTDDKMWVFSEKVGGETEFEALYIDQIVPFENYPDMHMRLMAEEFKEGTQISLGQGDDQRVSEILGVDESLENQSAYDDELVLVKMAEGENEDLVSWNFYHETEGLVLDLWPNMADPNAGDPNTIDPNDDGWYLAEPTEMTDVFGVFNPGRDRSNPTDRFKVWGKFTADSADFDADELFVRVGPWQATIATQNNPKFIKLGNRNAYLYQGSPDSGGNVSMLFDLNKGTFRIIGRDVDLTGLYEPVPVNIAIGDYFGQATAQVRGRGLSLKFISKYEDLLQCDWFKFSYDDGSNAYYSYCLMVLGGIATETYPLDLTGMKVKIFWSSKSYAIDAGELYQLPGHKYRYTNRSGKLQSAYFDLENCRFRIYIAKDHLSLLPQNLIIQITDEEDEVVFEESVRVQVGN